MDAVILAAGRGARVGTYAREFEKPLLPMGPVVDEFPSLILNAVRLARAVGVDQPVVVVAPSNAYAIDRELRNVPANMVIQRKPEGPGDALRIGLSVKPQTPSDRVLVLLADNAMSIDDVQRVSSRSRGETNVGVRTLTRDEATRFTWYDPDNRCWREKIAPPKHLTEVQCWVGPFVGWRPHMESTLRYAFPFNGEYLIGPHLSEFMHRTTYSAHVEVGSIDVGTNEAYREFVKGEGHSDYYR